MCEAALSDCKMAVVHPFTWQCWTLMPVSHPFTPSTCRIWVPRGCCKSTERAYNKRSQREHKTSWHFTKTQGPHSSGITHIFHHGNVSIWVKSQGHRVTSFKGMLGHFGKYWLSYWKLCPGQTTQLSELPFRVNFLSCDWMSWSRGSHSSRLVSDRRSLEMMRYQAGSSPSTIDVRK